MALCNEVTSSGPSSRSRHAQFAYGWLESQYGSQSTTLVDSMWFPGKVEGAVVTRSVSVIICTYNRADILPRVVGQIRAQDYPQDAFEIIVVDNRSADHTPQVVEQLAAEQGTSVRYVSEPRPGVTFARNRGAEEALYPYLAYIDDDCSIGPGWLRNLMSGFDLHAHVVAVGGLLLLKWEGERPSWIGPEIEPWLADTSFLGDRPRLLNDDERVVESNTAFERRALRAAGGWLGMEQFGSRNLAAGEILYLLYQLRDQGGKVAFVPEAVMYHHVSAPSRKRMLRRAYWQGVSDTLLEHLIRRQSWASTPLRMGLDLAALLILTGLSAASHIRMDSARGMSYLVRAVRRLGCLLAEMRIVGNWHRMRSWLSEQNLANRVGNRLAV